ncbi:MAG: Rid family detoxifying hydrolase [Verrucomicrobiales bacterium]
MKPQAVQPASAPKPVGPYSHGIRIGDFLFCSGQIPLDSAGQIVAGGIEEQTRQVISNIKGILQSEGLGLEQVVKATIFLTDLGNFAAVNAIYGNEFVEPYPARSTIGVSALPRGAMVEIEIVACYSTP